MIAIFGLGNPGNNYDKTRHNIGFFVLDLLLAKINKITDRQTDFISDKKHQAEIAKTTVFDQEVLLIKPHKFMNLSGEVVLSYLSFYKITPENCWVIYDDLDLPLGKIRIREKGSAGTHNGMKSIVQKIGTSFPRWRIGIESRGESAPLQQETASFVLSKFTTEEQNLAEKSSMLAVDSLIVALEKDLATSMNSFNRQANVKNINTQK